uniref:alanine--tRNA ligase n=1 Tax=Ndongobacter massiliensis TaxID=1871025 RepID=UPI0009306B6A|nr:alanine--tRNA ligase [Ndongobacter massiliensis]
MKKLDMNEIRKAFLDFFEERGHNRLKSYSLVPQDDPSLFLINAGMAPLKPYFTGEKKMAHNRATSSQRCVRTQDIEQVGKTHRHATFFEMLGNFSFGDYFKKEAIHWAWSFLTEKLEMEKDRFWITVYQDDDEAYRIWHEEIGIPQERLLRLGKEDNFWELEQGPCGPCSEIHYDRGPAYGEGHSPQDNSDRFMEIWNLVFTQFDRGADGSYTPLAHPNIDTGMGLERITLVAEDAHNIFELSSFAPIREEIERLSGVAYGSSKSGDESIRVIMDHSKALTFLVSDGVVPSNEGRGYILRRLLRRACRHGKRLGISGAFLNQVVDAVITCYQGEYEELVPARERIHMVVAREEANFNRTIDQGLQLLQGIVERAQQQHTNVLSGEEAFRLYDTYGFPLDLTKEILAESDMQVDEEGFSRAMAHQRKQSREHRQSGAGWSGKEKLDTADLPQTVFSGYECNEDDSEVLAIFEDGVRVDRMDAGKTGIVVLDRSPFYAESGGQVHDTGVLETKQGQLRVTDVQKDASKVFLHTVQADVELSQGQRVHCVIDVDRRNDIRRNHSATHLLHKALRLVLGEHVQQAGSYVEADRFRFDFTHFEALTEAQVREVEEIVNREIFHSLPVRTQVLSYTQAVNEGAIGLFEDKYEDQVRVVSTGDFSKELCGGTHVENTAQIMMLRIVSEQGISSGVRRMEAVTGRACYRRLVAAEDRLDALAGRLKTNREGIEERLEQREAEEKELQRKVASFASKVAGDRSQAVLADAISVGEVQVMTAAFTDVPMASLKETVDQLKEKASNYCIVLASKADGKVLLVAAVDPALNGCGLQAGKIVKVVAQATGGNGGGRPDFATAGGKDPQKVEDALRLVEKTVRAQLQK